MEAAIEYINSNVAFAPYIIFGLLVLAGFNIPVSEDFMLFTSAMLAAKNPEYTTHLFIGVFAGAYVSDLICYGFMGRYLGTRIFKIKFFSNMISNEKLEKMNSFYAKYGIATLIVGRFIPFGVRNALFLTAGLGKMNALKFAISDFIACVISCVFFYYIYFTYGETVIEYVKKGNLILFGLAILAVTGYYVKKNRKQARSRA